MPYLLDTNVFLHAVIAPERLNRRARRLLSHTSGSLLVSAVSSWEIIIKHALGRLELPESPATWVPSCLRRLGAQPLDVTHPHTFELVDLPHHHQDPFDRMLIAQAKHERLTILTTDSTLQRYPVQVILCED